MSEQDSKHPLKRFVLIALVLVVILLGLSNLDELTGLATGQGGAEGGCGGGLTAVELESMGEAAASALFSCQKNTDSGPLSCSLMLPQIDARGFEAEVDWPFLF